jgi:SAM-dependent methyltransferase
MVFAMETNKPDDIVFSDFDRINREKVFHDQQALSRLHAFSSPDNYLFTDEQYLSHESWVRAAVLKLGDLKGKRVLDLGCGHGMASVLFARQGALVTALDVSPGYLAEAKNRAFANGLQVNVMAACAELLPFADNSFDLIWGNAILHHLNLDFAQREILRVLVPHGKAVFCEPVSFSVLTRLIRSFMALTAIKKHTFDEESLTWATLLHLKQIVPNLTWEGNQFLGSIPRLLRLPWLNGFFDRADHLFCRNFFYYNRLCRYAILEFQKTS